jgi:hypothetical protein
MRNTRKTIRILSFCAERWRVRVSNRRPRGATSSRQTKRTGSGRKGPVRLIRPESGCHRVQLNGNSRSRISVRASGNHSFSFQTRP